MIDHSRKKLEKKSRPFTTIKIQKLLLTSVCGDKEFQVIWKEFFDTDNKLIKDKSRFFWDNLKKDLGEAEFEDFLDSRTFKRHTDEFWDLVLDKLEKARKPFQVANKQEYLREIVLRATEQKNNPRKKGKINKRVKNVKKK